MQTREIVVISLLSVGFSAGAVNPEKLQFWQILKQDFRAWEVFIGSRSQPWGGKA